MTRTLLFAVPEKTLDRFADAALMAAGRRGFDRVRNAEIGLMDFKCVLRMLVEAVMRCTALCCAATCCFLGQGGGDAWRGRSVPCSCYPFKLLQTHMLE